MKKSSEDKKADMKKYILEGAIGLFALKGYHQVTTKLLSKHLQISEGLIYHYFRNKEEILNEFIVYFADMFDAPYEKNLKGKTGKENLKNFIEEYFDLQEKNIQLISFGFSVTLSPETSSISKQYIYEKVNSIIEITAEFFRQNGFENPEFQALEFQALMDGIGQHYLGSKEVYPLEMMKNYVIDKYCS